MADLHLVTGYRGEPHITAVDQGWFNAGCVGVGEYVLATGRRFEAQIITSNAVRIFDGSLLMQGRHVNLDASTYADVIIPSGSQSVNRNDLIVVRYQKNSSTGVEGVTLEVIQGTATSGTPSDPSYNTNSIFDGSIVHDMPLYRVKLSGLTIERVEPMFKVLAPLSDVQYKPSLLVNGDFQCNQRGSTTWDISTNTAYSVDMWRMFQVKGELSTNGIKIAAKSTSVQGYFTQFVNVNTLAEK